MKHVWSMDTVQRGRSGVQVHEWIQDKVRSFGLKTGVAWSCEEAHGKFIFWPYMRKDDAQFADHDIADMIIKHLASKGDSRTVGYISVLTLALELDLPLPETCGTCWALVKCGALKATVDRMGKPHAVALA